MLVKDAMVGEVVSCTPGSSLQGIAILMWNNDCGCIPVVDSQEHPVGIVTDRDIAMAAALKHKPLWDITVEEATAARKIICCGLDDDIQEALGLMEQYEVRRLPVVNQYGQLCGMLTMGDILSFTRAVRSRSKKFGNSQIDASEIMGFLKHVSAHHKPQKPCCQPDPESFFSDGNSACLMRGHPPSRRACLAGFSLPSYSLSN